VRNLAVVQNVALSTLTDEVHLDAVIDTGSTLCVVPPVFARRLGFDSSNRLEAGPVAVIGGGYVQMDVHMLEWVKVGSAKAYSVRFGVQNTFAGPGARKMLVGLTFIKHRRTTFDFGGGHALFRSR
jgi:predicted aspartyl protease